MNNNINISIDGPSGAGKSTIAKRLAKETGYVYLDTGAMYRAVGLKVFRSNISLEDTAAIEKLLATTKISITYEGGSQKILLDGEDVSQGIRQHHVSKLASDVSALKSVRLKMVELQREIANESNSILDGRDIGTFVLPNAQFKFFLTAAVEQRAKRRYKELKSKGFDCDLTTIQKDIAERDYNDTHRDFAPLKKAEDAIELDTTHLNIKQVTQKILDIISAKK